MKVEWGGRLDPPMSRLTHAVRLSREAVLAWASLLHGSTVVTTSR